MLPSIDAAPTLFVFASQMVGMDVWFHRFHFVTRLSSINDLKDSCQE